MRILFAIVLLAMVSAIAQGAPSTDPGAAIALPDPQRTGEVSIEATLDERRSVRSYDSPRYPCRRSRYWSGPPRASRSRRSCRVWPRRRGRPFRWRAIYWWQQARIWRTGSIDTDRCLLPTPKGW